MAARTLACRELTLPLGERTLIMGILNITPDSFSDGGRYTSVEQAVARARQMVAEGADILDIGGESTRPGAAKVALEEELERVLPVIEALKGIGVPISVDTYKPQVAEQALAAGAHIINDIWGFKDSKEMSRIAAAFNCPVVLMHNRPAINYQDFVPDVVADLRESVELALAAGVGADKIVLDPGIGFAKTYEHNLYLMNHLRDIAALGYPVLLGTSRKSFIQRSLQLPADDVVEGTGATVALGIAQGCQMVRVHDVKAMKRVAAMTDAIVYARKPEL